MKLRSLPRTTHVLKSIVALSGPPADRQAASRIQFLKNGTTYLRPKVFRGVVRFHVWRNVDPDHLRQHGQQGELSPRQAVYRAVRILLSNFNRP